MSHIRRKIAKKLLNYIIDHQDHDHVLRYKEIKINDKTDFTTKPHRVLYEEFGPGRYGIWYEECDV